VTIPERKRMPFDARFVVRVSHLEDGRFSATEHGDNYRPVSVPWDIPGREIQFELPVIQPAMDEPGK
jgi:hypothetical protein